MSINIRRGLAALSVVVLASALSVALAPSTSAGIGSVSVTIHKAIVGSPPAGTEFTITRSCTGTVDTVLTFDEEGAPQEDPHVNLTPGPRHCTIVENTSGGASGFKYACTATGSANSCDADHKGANWTGGTIATQDLTVVNTFFVKPTVTPASTVPGGLVTVTGSLCTLKVDTGNDASLATGAPVTVTIGLPTPIVLTTTGAPTTGNWSVSFTVPAGVSGPFPVTAECGDPIPYPNAAFTVVGAAAAFTG
jgi:hypothetical protein